MTTMYLAKVNAPSTTLSSGISDTATVIPVNDINVFPAAPCIAVIGGHPDDEGGGELAETILYAVRNEGTSQLTSVTREFDKDATHGAKRAWAAGTTIVRAFTAYDHNKFKTNIETLQDDVDGIRGFAKGWTLGTLLGGAGIDTDPTELLYRSFFYSLAGYTFYEPWKNINGWTTSNTGSGSQTLQVVRYILATGTTNNSRSALSTAVVFDHPYKSGLDMILQTIQSEVALTASTFRIYLVKSGVSIPPADTSEHGGFKIINGQIWASNGNGSTETATDCGVSIASQWATARLRMIGINSGIEFYIGATLKATHTTNLPTAWSYYLYISITNSSAINQQVALRPIILQG